MDSTTGPFAVTQTTCSDFAPDCPPAFKGRGCFSLGGPLTSMVSEAGAIAIRFYAILLSISSHTADRRRLGKSRFIANKFRTIQECGYDSAGNCPRPI
jgi:hypothetical protein